MKHLLVKFMKNIYEEEKEIYRDLIGFIEKEYDVKVNINTESWRELKNRVVFTNKNKIRFSRRLKNNKFTKQQLNRIPIVLKSVGGGDFQLNEIITDKETVKQFKQLLEDVVRESGERNETTEGMPMIETSVDFEPIPGLTVDENREHQGVLNPTDTTFIESRIGDGGTLQIQVNHIQDKIAEVDRQIEETDNPFEVEPLNERRMGLERERDETIQQRELEEETYEERQERLSVRSAQEEDITRLEKFKKWAKENMVGLSAIGIAIGGIVRKAVFQGAKAVGAFGKFVGKIAKSLGPLLAPLLSVLSTIISWGARGSLWLSQNLWILAYDYWMEKSIY